MNKIVRKLFILPKLVNLSKAVIHEKLDIELSIYKQICTFRFYYYISLVKKQFTTTIGKLDDSRVYMYHLLIPKEIVDYYKKNNQKRLMCTVNDMKAYSSAILFAKNQYAYINLTKERMKILQTKVGDKVEVALEADTSEYGMPLPRELEEIIIQDNEFKKVFHKLTPGKQRNLIYLVSKMKSENKRIEKAIIIANYLKRVNGQLDFKELNQAFKDGI